MSCGGAFESLLAHMPTVAANVGGLPELVIDGVTGRLVPPNDPAALADAVLAMLSDPDRARAMTDARQQLARDLFDVQKAGRQVAEFYEYVLAQSTATAA